MLNQRVTPGIEFITGRSTPPEPKVNGPEDDSYGRALDRELQRGAPAESSRPGDESSQQTDATSSQRSHPTRPERDHVDSGPDPKVDGDAQADELTSQDSLAAEPQPEDASASVTANEPAIQPATVGTGLVSEEFTLSNDNPSQELGDFDVGQTGDSVGPTVTGESVSIQAAEQARNDQLAPNAQQDVPPTSPGYSPSVDGRPHSPASLQIGQSGESVAAQTEIVVPVTKGSESAVTPPRNLQLEKGQSEKGRKPKSEAAHGREGMGSSSGPESFFANPVSSSQGTVLAATANSVSTTPVESQLGSAGNAAHDTVEQLSSFQGIDGAEQGQRRTPEQAPVQGLQGVEGSARAETLTSATGAANEPRVDQGQIVERVTQLVQSAEQSGRVIRARLHPPELGALQVEVRQGQTGAVARQTIETTAAQQVPNDHMQQIQDALGQVGPIERVEIQLGESHDSSDARRDGEREQGEQSGFDGTSSHDRDHSSPGRDDWRGDPVEESDHGDIVSPANSSGARASRGVDLSELDVAV